MITAHIASVIGREESLKQVIVAVSPQVDKTYVSLNGYQVEPDWITTLHKIRYVLCDNNLTDGAKWLHVNDEPSICVILDDDLIVSPTFVNYMLSGLYKYGGAVSLHGKRFDTRPILRYRRSYTANCRCLGTCVADMPVHVIGTGCTLFDNRRIILDQSVYEFPNMADVLFSRFCYTNNIPMTVLKHRAGQFLRYIKPSTTIWQATKDDKIQTEIVNSFLK